MSNADWGAIPRQLAEDVSLTLKKKFNVQTGFKPVEWNKNIKGLTPLPEKTVSGSVVAFSDGADDVPLKSCEVTIAPTLDGVSSVDVVHGGKNLLDASILENGNFQTISPQSTHNVVTDGFIPIKGGANYVYSCLTSTSGVYFRFFDSTQTEIPDSAVNAYNATLKTFTTPSNAIYIRVMWYQSSSEISVQDIIDRNVMVEVGSTPSTYAPYVAPTTHAANLGRTIYGGSGDVVNGEGQETFEVFTFDGSDDEDWSYSNGRFKITWSGTFEVFNTNHYRIRQCNNLTVDNVAAGSYELADNSVTWFTTNNIFIRKQVLVVLMLNEHYGRIPLQIIVRSSFILIRRSELIQAVTMAILPSKRMILSLLRLTLIPVPQLNSRYQISNLNPAIP